MGSSRRILVTGGSGFLGGHIVRQLLDDATTTVAIVSRHPKVPSGVTDTSRISLLTADLSDPAQVKAVFQDFKPRAVIHAASPSYMETAANLIKANINGTKALIDSATSCQDTQAFVFTSTDSAVVPTHEPTTEEEAKLYDDKTAPNAYALTKVKAEKLVLAADSAQLRTAVLRIPCIYGEYDTNLAPQLVASLRRKEHKMQIGNDTKVFEVLYVNKAAEAHILAMQALLSLESVDDVGGEAFFISDGRPQPLFDFNRRFYAAAGHPVARDEVTVIPLAVMQAMASTTEWIYWIFTLGTIRPSVRRVSINHLGTGCCWSLDKARKILGYEPVLDQDDAIQKTMDWAIATL
ncbi:hypothetical protein FGRMN_934 [Fusarium graminum]|nr:hypothetical protein FGRMN_934 [Fusarium graminum]